jgi:hypothetical protein
MKFIYIEPYKFLDDNLIESHTFELLYSILTTNAYLNYDIKIFTDFDGMIVLSTLPLSIKIIYGNTPDKFNENVFRHIDYNYKILNKDIHFKPQVFNIEHYLNENNDINGSLINKLTINQIKNEIRNISEELYNRINENLLKLKEVNNYKLQYI